MNITCCWCGRPLDVNGRLGWMRELHGRLHTTVDPRAVIPLFPAPPAAHVAVRCVFCHSTVYVPADLPEATA